MNSQAQSSGHDVPGLYRTDGAELLIGMIGSSFAALVGRPLCETHGDPVAGLWHAPRAIVAHGIQDDPLFFFGNRYALNAFECDVSAFVGMPSRLSAEAPLRAERQRLLDRVSAQGFIDDYAGVRISATGRRFPIAGAIVWNLVDDGGQIYGQAATFVL